jgi:hypothetical protein
VASNSLIFSGSFLTHPLVYSIQQNVSTEEWFGDGTWDKVPGQYCQLYSLHSRIGFTYTPFIYFLLPNKDYRNLSKNVPNYQTSCASSPQRLLLDFEQGAHTAFKSIYPGIETSGCFFHLRQSVHQKVQELGLKRQYEQDLEFATLVKCITALSFVPR